MKKYIGFLIVLIASLNVFALEARDFSTSAAERIQIRKEMLERSQKDKNNNKCLAQGHHLDHKQAHVNNSGC